MFKIEYKKLKEYANQCVGQTIFGIALNQGKFSQLLDYEAKQNNYNLDYVTRLNINDNCFDIYSKQEIEDEVKNKEVKNGKNIQFK